MTPNRRTNETILAGAALLVIAVAAIITAGCTTGTSTPGAVVVLTGPSWSLDSYLAGNGTPTPVIPGSEVTARFGDDGKVTGSAGCNRYGADYHLEGTDLSVSPAISTKMYCGEPEGLMEQEARFLELLSSAAGCRIENDRLEITDASGAAVLTFVKMAPADLAGTSWTLASLAAEDGTMIPVIADTTVTAAFGADGTLGGSAGCNRYGADYTRRGAGITIEASFMTEMYCGVPEGLMEQEDRYLVLLANVSSYRVEGDRLILTDAAGADLLFFVQAEEVPEAPLTGTLWILESFTLNGDALSSPIAGTTITAEFAADGNVAGSAGCNHYSAVFDVSGNTMTIGPAGSTKMYCGEPEGVMEQEAGYLTLLESVAGYRIDADRLDLLDEAGKRLLSYRAGSAD